MNNGSLLFTRVRILIVGPGRARRQALRTLSRVEARHRSRRYVD